MVLDFSRAGWKAAIKEFCVSLVKTAIAAALAAIVAKLAEISVPVDSDSATIVVAILALFRAAITSFSKWVTTLNLPASS